MTASPEAVSREAFVVQLMSMGVPKERAETEATRRYGPVRSAVELERDERALEKAEQLEVQKVYRAFGCTVYWLSQARAARQTPGMPDLRIFAPRAGAHWDHETKRQGRGDKDLEPAQRDYREHAEQCGLDVVVGDRFAAGDQLVRLGLAVWDGDRLEPVR
ncbi:MAG TPA: hypothetical protein VFK04_12885 [Gemmatimonadaceae bacterium]|nr:hypothetical protein [Gemmatimonadaceae bacterium]